MKAVNWVLATLVCAALIWKLPEWDAYQSPEERRQAIQSAEYSIRAAWTELELHDETRDRLVEIRTLEILSLNPDLTRTEARHLAVAEVAEIRSEISDFARDLAEIYEDEFDQPRPVK